MTPCCGSCIYWKQFNNECRRHSPTKILSPGDNGHRWPQVYPDEWCGDFEEKKEPQS